MKSLISTAAAFCLVASAFIGCENMSVTDVVTGFEQINEQSNEEEQAREIILLPVGEGGNTGIFFHNEEESGVNETHIRYTPHTAVTEEDDED